MTTPHLEYERRLGIWRAQTVRLERTHRILSTSRLILAGVGLVLLWMAFVRGTAPAWLPLLVWAAFGVLLVRHALVLNRADRARRAESIYGRGLDRLDGRWQGGGRDGSRFLEGHPYARDLDLFGRASLFELLNTTRTEAGEGTLAAWLREGAPIPEILARQGAVDELRNTPDFREDLAILAAESPVGRTGALASWAAAEPAAFPTALGPVLTACAVSTVVLAAAAFDDRLSLAWVVAWVLLSAGLASIWRRSVHAVLHAVDVPAHDLTMLVELLARIERETFTSSRLAALQQALMTDRIPPSRRIAQLRSLTSWLDSTHNMFFAPIAWVLLVRPQCAIAIARWHRRHGAAVGEWLRAIGELEALGALGTYAYERPADPFPTLVADGPVFEAVALRHPLLADDVSVGNDVRLGGEGAPRVYVVSGSNMSGKSTLLRAVGVNVVLALAGAPVRASRLGLSRLVLGATLRIEDSLDAGHSRFYAELLRIKTIVEASRGAVPLLFLLDEILHGTNSADRRIGAEAIVRALADAGAIGFVTTHDLALTELAGPPGGVAVNIHFEDRLEEGTMRFDYRIRPGVVEHSNALALMRAVGLDV